MDWQIQILSKWMVLTQLTTLCVRVSITYLPHSACCYIGRPPFGIWFLRMSQAVTLTGVKKNFPSGFKFQYKLGSASFLALFLPRCHPSLCLCHCIMINWLSQHPSRPIWWVNGGKLAIPPQIGRVCNNQSLKGAVGMTLCQNEAEVKFQMDIDNHISTTEAGRWNVVGNIHLKSYFSLILAGRLTNCSF